MAQPKLRFPEFSGDWEEKNIVDIAQIYQPKTIGSSDFIENGKYDVFGANGYIGKYDKYNHESAQVVVSCRGSCGEVNFVKGKTWITGNSMVINIDDVDYIEKKYLYEFLSANNLKKLISGSVQPQIVRSAFNTFVLKFPDIFEQQKIAGFLSEVDSNIANAEAQVEQWKQIKKGLLQKMFPQKGKMAPEIRFPEFTNDWEQRKLSELATMHARIGWQNLRTSEFLDDGDYMLITGTDFEDGRINYSTCHYVEKERYDQDKHIQISDGSILITKDGTLGKVAYVQGLQKPATLNAGVFNVEIKDKNEVDGKYLFQYLKAPFLMDYVGQKATGGTIKHLNQNILVDFPVVMPKKAEQEKIGQYFEDIDNLITLHQQIAKSWKTIKKGLLQQMFV